MRWEVINPSDPYFIESDSLEVAAIACLVLGDGKYALQPVDPPDGDCVPIFAFAHDPDGEMKAWFLAHGVPDVGEFTKANLEPLRDAMITVDESLPDEDRSSVNNIGKAALEYANAISQTLADARSEAAVADG